MKINCTQKIEIYVVLRDLFDFTAFLSPSCTYRLRKIIVHGLTLKLYVINILVRNFSTTEHKQFNNDKITVTYHNSLLPTVILS